MINFAEVSTERVVSIYYCEVAGIPTDLAILGVPVPEGFSYEEIVVLYLSSKRCWWNVENSLSSVEVVKISGYFVASNFPGRMLSVSIERML